MDVTASRSQTHWVVLALMLGAALLASVALPAIVTAADGETEETPGAITTVNGKRFKMAKAKLADRITRIADPSGDQVGPDGASASSAAPHTDLAAAYVARVKVPAKLVKKMRKDYPRGRSGAIYGTDANWSKGQNAAYVAVQLAAPRPDEVPSQQVEIAFDGPEAVPVQAAYATEPRVGVQRFSLSGRFADGSYASGTTDLAGWQPGTDMEFYNARSGNMGYYDAREGVYHLIAPIPGGATAVAVTLRTATDDGELVDRLELPAGGRFVVLDDPAGGYDPSAEAPALACRSVETRALSGAAEDGSLVRLTVGAADGDAFQTQLAEPLEGIGQLEIPVRPVGSDEEPTLVAAEVRLAPVVGAAFFSLELPAGRWLIGPIGEGGPTTPGGEALVDVRTLTGSGGLLTGASPVGIAAGDTGCGRWTLAGDACDIAPEAPLASLVGLDPAGVARSAIVRPDGTRWCVGVDAETERPKYVVGIGDAFVTAADLERDVEAHRCPATPVELGVEGVILDCGTENFESFVFRVVPEVAASSDPEAGLLVSIDVVVDPGRPFGERYDGALALETFEALGREVAAAAEPAAVARLSAAETDDEPSDTAPPEDEAPADEEAASPDA